MKCHITSYERFALASHLVGLPSPNPEYARKRLRAWDELGVADLADQLATGAAIGGDIQIAAYRDTRTPHLIDLSEDIMIHLIAALGGAIAGVWSDTLTRVRERLERLRDKVYELPPELRTLKAVAE